MTQRAPGPGLWLVPSGRVISFLWAAWVWAGCWAGYRAIPVTAWRRLPGNEANVGQAELSCWIWMEGLDPAEPEAGPLSSSLTPVNTTSHTDNSFSFCLHLLEGPYRLQPRKL